MIILMIFGLKLKGSFLKQLYERVVYIFSKKRCSGLTW